MGNSKSSGFGIGELGHTPASTPLDELEAELDEKDSLIRRLQSQLDKYRAVVATATALKRDEGGGGGGGGIAVVCPAGNGGEVHAAVTTPTVHFKAERTKRTAISAEPGSSVLNRAELKRVPKRQV